MKSRKTQIIYILIGIFLLVIMLANIFMPKKIISVNALELEKINCTAKSMCVIEQSTKRILLQKDYNIELPMASTTKIMTTLVALDNCDNLDEQFLTDNRAVGIEGTSIYLRKDEKLSIRELLYGLMLNSGNDAAMAIAYKIGNGNVDAFVDLMNKKAEELNLKNTHFDNPHGLDSKTHFTSSYDLAVITAKAMENEDFREIVKTPVKQISAPKEMGNRFVRNKHKLLGKMEGCEGVKTGFTDNAKRCCVTSCYKNNMRLICVVLNCGDMFNESQKCLESCYENYSMKQIIEPYKYVGETNVENGIYDKVKLYIKNGFSMPMQESESDDIKIEVNYDKNLISPIEKGKEVGELKVFLKNELIYCEKIYTIEEVREKNVGDKMKDIFEKWYLGTSI